MAALGSISMRRRVGGMSDGEGTSLSLSSEYPKRPKFQYFGWVYHLGFSKLAQEYSRLRFLFIRGKYVDMYKRDPHHNPSVKPIRRGVVGPSLTVEDLGCRKINTSDMYVLRFFNRLDESKKGEAKSCLISVVLFALKTTVVAEVAIASNLNGMAIACATAEEAQRWMEAFEQAKQQAEYELSSGGSARDKLNMEAEINLDAHRHKVRKYAYGFIKLIRIGQGPETLMRQSSTAADDVKTDGYLGADDDADAIEAHTWKCVCTMNGIRIFEDVSDSKVGKSVLVKSVGIIDASADCVFEVLMSLDPSKRYEWDMLTSDLELVEAFDGNYDVVYGTFDPKYFTWWYSKRDFVLSRQWFHGQNGTYTSTWEIKDLCGSSAIESPRCLLTHMLEIQYESFSTWKKNRSSKFEKSIPYALLCQVAGIREYVGANPGLTHQCASSVFDSKSSGVGDSVGEFYDAIADEFYDAIAIESSSDDDEDSDKDAEIEDKDQEMPKNVKLPSEETPVAPAEDLYAVGESDSTILSVQINPDQFCGSLPQGKEDNDKNCWTNPGGAGFMIRGKTYLKDYAKVVGGDPFLKLIAVDWLKADRSLDKVALRPSCVVQSEAGKSLPFILIVNLQIPAKPEYNMVFYYAADRPISDDSLLGKFIQGSDAFRDSRFKLIPSIVKGYWVVKRAVGSKACLLGKALTCRYLRQDNFLEIDVDIGSSSVARSVIGLVLGYVSSLVVDLALLVEAKGEDELPEFLLGTVRLNCLQLDTALDT